MRKLITIGLVFFVLFSLVSVGYSSCEGDISCNGTVDGSDLALLAADFGTSGCGTCDDVIARIDELEDKIDQLETLLQHFTRSGNDIYITEANLHVRNGGGYTGATLNGLGNLIVGYNERQPDDDHSGSHNIIIGRYHEYTSHSGLVVGAGNTISGEFATVTGGTSNTASGKSSSVSGGAYNTAVYDYASVSGGGHNTASRGYASVSGGNYNTASGSYASVSGGRNNIASGEYAFVGGGGGSEVSDGNKAFARYSSILGGWRNITGDPNLEDLSIGWQSVVSAGSSNVASGDRSAVSGGYDNIADAAGASVSGGRNNNASAVGASVSGGDATSAINNFDWRAGSCYFCDD